jgi:hypothetical protein
MWLGCTVHCVARLHGVSGLEFDSATHAPGSHYEYYDYQQGGVLKLQLGAPRTKDSQRLTLQVAAFAASCSSCTLRVRECKRRKNRNERVRRQRRRSCVPPPPCVAEEMAWFGTRKSHSQLKPTKMSTTNCVGRGSTLYYEEAPCTTRKHPVLH